MKTQTQTHTPGPWASGIDTDDESAQIISADGQHLATVEQYPLEANAALIASAPDLLAALEEASICAIQGVLPANAQRARWIDAIAKAEGGAA